MSKNVADYTDFNGKTFKKIVQPPGGVSSFSLGWGYEQKDDRFSKTQTTRKCLEEVTDNINHNSNTFS